jgi:hypothetical protein
LLRRWCCVVFLAALLPCSSCSCPGRGRKAVAVGDGPAVVVVEPDAGNEIRPIIEKENNDQPQTAQSIEVDLWYQGSIGGRGGEKADVDYYRLVVAEDRQVLSVTLAGVVGVDLALTALAGPTGTTKIVTLNDNGAGGGETLANLSVNKGQYLLLVTQRVRKGKEAGKGSYLLQARLRGLEEGEEAEPNGTRKSANDLALGEETIGYLGWSGDTDWYRIPLDGFTDGSRLGISFEGVDGVRAYVSLRTARGRRIQSRWGGPGEPIVLNNVVPPRGAKFIYVLVGSRRSSNVESRYSLAVNVKAGLQTVEEENNDSAKSANELQPGESVWGMIPHRGDKDYYRIVLPASSFVKVMARAPAGLDLRLLSLNEEGKVRWQMDANQIGGREHFPALYLPVERPLVVVRSAKKGPVDSTASYSLKVETLPGRNWEKEPNEKAEQATVFSATARRFQGFIYPAGDVDVFRFVAVSKQLSMRIVPPGAQELKVDLVDEQGGIIARAKPRDGEQSMGISATLSVGQVYFLRVSAAKDAFNLQTPYSLEILPGAQTEVAP